MGRPLALVCVRAAGLAAAGIGAAAGMGAKLSLHFGQRITFPAGGCLLSLSVVSQPGQRTLSGSEGAGAWGMDGCLFEKRSVKTEAQEAESSNDVADQFTVVAWALRRLRQP